MAVKMERESQLSMQTIVDDVCDCKLPYLHCALSCAVYCNRPCLFVCLLRCALSLAAQCVVIGPVCLQWAGGRCGFVGGSLTTITRNCMH